MAASKVDMSLDDIIKKTKIGKGGRRGRGLSNNTQNTTRGGRQLNSDLNFTPRRISGRGIRRAVGQRRAQPQRFTPRGNIEGVWTHDLYQARPTTNTRVNSEGKLLISNLDFGVSESDIKDLFSEFGQLKKSAVHFDFSGRSLGTAEVIFTLNQDAIKAMNRYNSVPLDGRPMNIQIVGSTPSVQTRVQRVPTTTRTFGSRAFIGGYNTSTRGRGVGRGGARGGRGGRGGGRGGSNQPSLTKEQLDAQLDSYNKMDVE